MRQLPALFVALLCSFPLVAATELIITVTDRKTGEPVTGLQASDFTILVDSNAKRIEKCEYVTSRVDIVLMLDASPMGQPGARLAPSLVGELGEEEEMSIVSYDTSAEMIQDFTGSKESLRAALSEVRFGNSPRLLDALYAVAADGFEGATYRRVILLLTSGVDGQSRVTDEEVIQLCRRNGVSVFPVHIMGYGRSKLRQLARLTGGAIFVAQDVSKHTEDPAKTIFEAMRGHYRITLSGNLPLGDKAKFEISGQKGKKINVSFLEVN